MYKTFRVKNFRCFRDLQISDLGRVNLIAGANNTGKTALMEAMYLHTRPCSPGELWNLQQVRGIDFNDDNRTRSWRQFFYRMDSDKTIEIEGHHLLPKPRPILCIEELANTKANEAVYQLYAKNLQTLGMSQIEAAKAASELEEVLHLVQQDESTLHGSAFLPSDPKLPVIGFKDRKEQSQFFPVRGIPASESLTDKYSMLKVEGQHIAIDDALKKLEPKLTDVEVLSPDGQRRIWVTVDGVIMPLHLLGEGSIRFASILMVMRGDKPEHLFIDEIENGIHYSVQQDVWQDIGEAAREHDIQIFATTHSWEMIEAAHEAFKDDDSYEFRFHRLDRNLQTGDIEAVTYNEFGMDAVTSISYEVRG